MPDYRNSKIYVIRSYQTDKVYVGSTVQRLSKRFYEHKCKSKDPTKCNSSRHILKYNDCFIELIEKYPCNDADELRKREGEWIRKLDCVNKQISGRDKREYYIDNREQILVKQKKYNEENKQKLLEYSKYHYQKNIDIYKNRNANYWLKNKDKLKINLSCGCGGSYTKQHKAGHFRTKRHKLWQLNAHNIFNHL